MLSVIALNSLLNRSWKRSSTWSLSNVWLHIRHSFLKANEASCSRYIFSTLTLCLMEISYHARLSHGGLLASSWCGGKWIFENRDFGAVGRSGGGGRSGAGDDGGGGGAGFLVVVQRIMVSYFARRVGSERVLYAVWSCASERGRG